ncbi:MAG: hypothetical protein ACRCXX_13880 [Cetobacterium sp.]|uniref:hypothetical protein n=1 Tax=Cetobacterium sp. TaxID=2071632 RepID=UPI003F3ABE3A
MVKADIINSEYIKGIKPSKENYKNKESDKYSYLLYEFLKKNKKLRVLKVYSKPGGKSFKIYFAEGVYLNPKLTSCPNFTRFAELFNILTGQRKNVIKMCYVLESFEQAEDITDEFYKSYAKFGRCCWIKHDSGLDYAEKGKYIYTKNGRKCTWCGQWFTKKIKKVVTIKREVVWENA